MSQDFSLEEDKDLPGVEEFSEPGDISLPPEKLLQRFGMQSTGEVEPDLADLPLLKADAELEHISETLDAGIVAVPVDPGVEMATGGFLPDPFEVKEEDRAVLDERAWFVIHCYSGYEQKVKHNLEQRIESMGMQDFIFQVVVPTVEEIEIKDGKRRSVERCLYPGYIMVQAILTDDSWYCVRNTPGVTGFVGMGNNPVPLRQEQVQSILRRMEAAAPQVRATFKPGQKVRIIEGPFADFIGVVEDIDEERTKVRVLVSFFGRETPVELDFLQVEKT